jgi:hypothetical protein
MASTEMDGGDQTVPAVAGFYDGQEIGFVHTDASDPPGETAYSTSAGSTA